MSSKVKPSQPARGKVRQFLSVVAIGSVGALVQYFTDPARGRRRRHVARDMLAARAHRLRRAAVRYGRLLAGRGYGRLHGTVFIAEPDNPYPDDNTLRDRVESKLFRHRDILKGDININVAMGTVELRGRVQHPADIGQIEELVAHIPGVTIIHNYLHVPNTPAPNKARVITAV